MADILFNDKANKLTIYNCAIGIPVCIYLSGISENFILLLFAFCFTTALVGFSKAKNLEYVVFYNIKDAFKTFLILIAFFIGILLPLAINDEFSLWEKGDSFERVFQILLASGLMFYFTRTSILALLIHNPGINGRDLLAVLSAKLFFGVAYPVLVIGSFFSISDKKGRARGEAQVIAFLLSLLGVYISLILINGEEVYEKRGQEWPDQFS